MNLFVHAPEFISLNFIKFLIRTGQGMVGIVFGTLVYLFLLTLNAHIKQTAHIKVLY